MGVRTVRKNAMLTVHRLHISDQHPSLQRLREGGARYVPGRGSLESSLAFVGEAPGRAEDRERRPFCGPSGRLLDEMLTSVGLTRGQVYVTNIVKYRPPNNRDPLPSEKAASLPHLYDELAVLGAPNVVALGRHALAAFLPGMAISTVHGVWHTSAPEAGYQCRVLPLYHPAVALYSGTRMPLLFKDFEAVLDGWTP